MTFEITIKKSAFKFIQELDQSYKKTVNEFLLIAKKQPVPSKDFDIVKLKSSSNTFRVRIGKIRVVYEVSWKDRNILINFVGWRKDAYK